MGPGEELARLRRHSRDYGGRLRQAHLLRTAGRSLARAQNVIESRRSPALLAGLLHFHKAKHLPFWEVFC